MKNLTNKFVTLITLALVAFISLPVVVHAEEPIPKFLLVKLTRDQSSVICSSEVFTQCMGFDQKECLTVSEKAIDTCLGPLPDEIDPTKLQNGTLEACPHKVYEEAGYSEEKAKECFDKAMAAAGESSAKQ